MGTAFAAPAKESQTVPPEDRHDIHSLWLILGFLIACAVIISRRPDAVFHAQFYAEDGRNWFADAYNYGWWRVLFHSYQGYLHLVPRLAAGLAQLAPVTLAPLVENLIAITIQALPVYILLSSRSRGWGSLRFRSAMALLYLLLPSTREMMATITESQWLLAFCAILLLFVTPPVRRRDQIFDLSIFVLCSLTGPFCIFLLLIVPFLAWQKRQLWSRIVAVLLLGSLIQAVTFFTQESSRHHAVLGANFEWLIRILGGQVFLGTLIGDNQFASRLTLTTLACVVAGGCLIIGYCALYSRTEMRAFLMFSVLIFIATLARPVTYPPPGVTAWQVIAHGSGSHYMFFMTLAFAWCLLECLKSRKQLIQIAAACLLFGMTIGLVREYRYPAFIDLHFNDHAIRLQAAPAGSTIIIPENPDGWDLTLHKH